MAHDRRPKPIEPTNRLVIELPLGSNLNLDKRVVEFIGAVKLLANGLQAIALALSTPQDNSAEVQKIVDQITASLNASATAEEDALKQANQPKEN